MTVTIELERLVRTSDLHGLARSTQQAVLAAGARPAQDEGPEGVRKELHPEELERRSS
ncbi:hypothetical protein KBX50_14560 [Micromonospora sp. C51]|uniref:hypothetical protein n=1 Tax=Micromonospora sp. C51 TaxID=2824879 RepID=UPI001B375722|nr:hypothetical protein [Micromonospora sp. C51]MBQ1049682.1 hypothetical protein [Micromonospora sp. C51]